MMAPHGEPIYAVVSGSVRIRNGGLGGRTIWLTGGGNCYCYAHLSDFAVGNGQSMSQGDLMGYNGATGNASGGSSHLHFEIHPAGGGDKPVPRRWPRSASDPTGLSPLDLERAVSVHQQAVIWLEPDCRVGLDDHTRTFDKVARCQLLPGQDRGDERSRFLSLRQTRDVIPSDRWRGSDHSSHVDDLDRLVGPDEPEPGQVKVFEVRPQPVPVRPQTHDELMGLSDVPDVGPRLFVIGIPAMVGGERSPSRSEDLAAKRGKLTCRLFEHDRLCRVAARLSQQQPKSGEDT